MSLERGFENQINPDHIYGRAREMLEVDAIDMEGFADLYGEEQIKKDRERVARREKEIEEGDSPEEKRAAKIATILEAIIHEQVEQSDWLGPDAHTIKPTRFDDLEAGVDSLVEFQMGEERSASYLGLAIDVTFSTRKMDRKLERIREHDIKRGELARIKYFESEYMGIRGELKDVPRVVIGADIKTVQELIEAWIDTDRKRKNKFFAEHPLQRLLLQEIAMQLETFEIYARSLGDRDDVADIYARTNAVIQRIISEKQTQKSTESLEDDRVFDGIRTRLKTVFDTD